MTLSDIGTAIFLVIATIALFVAFCRFVEAASRNRLRRMMASVGLDLDNIEDSDSGTGLDMNAVRSRCRRCPVENVCERWLAGEIAGDNSFCLNAKIFARAVKTD